MLVHEIPEVYQVETDYKDDKGIHWMLVRTLPGDEKKLQKLLSQHIKQCKGWRDELERMQAKYNKGSEPDDVVFRIQQLEKLLKEQGNILEFYNPVRTTIPESEASKSLAIPLFAGHVFVLATQQAITTFLSEYYPNGHVLYDRRVSNEEKSKVWVIPEAQMKFFRDFNDNYADKVIVLERPYTDYAFNPKTNKPNDIIKVLDGPLAGKTGYLARFKGNRRLVFNMQTPDGKGEMAVAIPDIWNFHCVLLHDPEHDVRSLVTKKERAADLLLGIIQSCGYVDEALRVFRMVMDILVEKASLVHLCQELFKSHRLLSQALTQLTAQQAELILYLVRYEQENPGYVRHTYSKLIIRPFLTPMIGEEYGGVKMRF